MCITKSYRIWTAPRTGYTLLAKMLEMTGKAGRPGEHINLYEEGSFQVKYGVAAYDELKHKIWDAGSDGGEIFACKIDGHAHSIQLVIKELSELKGVKEQTIERQFWHEFFPNCKDIYLTRRNKVRQAVSWWKAIQDGTWHLRIEEQRSQTPDFYDGKYIFDAIHHLFKETCLREASIQDYFEKLKISPLTIVYEDMIKDVGHTIKEILIFLEVETAGLMIPDLPFKRTSDAVSEEWVSRFRDELQKGWKTVAW